MERVTPKKLPTDNKEMAELIRKNGWCYLLALWELENWLEESNNERNKTNI